MKSTIFALAIGLLLSATGVAYAASATFSKTASPILEAAPSPSPAISISPSPSLIPTFESDTPTGKVIINGDEVTLPADIGPAPFQYEEKDVDGDGRIDLVRRETDGQIYSFKNYGTNAKPNYKEGKIFEGKVNFPQLEGSQSAIQQTAIQKITTREKTGMSTANGPANVCQPGEMMISYPRFDICVDTDYYFNFSRDINNKTFLDQLFPNFEKRYAAYENFTGWSFEENVKYKYNIYNVDKYLVVVNSSAAYGNVCWYGLGAPGISIVLLYNNLPNPNACAFANFETFNGTPMLNNQGELGQRWRYMTVFLHEAQHSTSPEPMKERGWLTEGNSIYVEGNILANYYNASIGQYDISHATADTYIYQGDFKWSWDGSRWGFNGYILNDYNDTCNCGNPPRNWPIQDSSGYYISGWMMSLLRDNYGLDWNKFYKIMDDNEEILQRALWKKYNAPFNDKHYLDAPIIDLFGRASGMDYQTQTVPRFRYDGINGPGWGVREWRGRDYPDLVATNLSFSKSDPLGGEVIQAISMVSNNGNVSLKNVRVSFYATNASGSTVLADEQMANFTSQTGKQVNGSINSSRLIPKYGMQTITVKVDEPDVKIEKSETNNAYSSNVTFFTPPTRPSCWYDKRNGHRYCS